MERFAIASSDGLPLIVRLWYPKIPARGIVQLAHGAGEHLGRYEALASSFNQRGFVVVGADHRGHGDNQGLHGRGAFGPRGFAALVEDMASVATNARSRNHGLPLVLVAHSMGSFAAQVMLARYAELLDGLVLSGTTAIDLLLETAAAESLAALNANFEPARTSFDWLTRDAAEVDRYIADPLCGFDLEAESMATIAHAVRGVRSVDRLAAASDKAIPVLLLSGELDPVGGPGQTLAGKVAIDFHRAGLSDVDHRIYAGARHELFFELNCAEVIGDLLEWAEARLLRY